MEIEIKIDKEYSTPKIIILTDRMTDEIRELLSKFSEEKTDKLIGFREEKAVILDFNSIIRIYTSSGKVVALTEKGEYTLKQRLYEIENILDKNIFVRISNSEVVNLKKVKNFDLSLSGTICVKMNNGDKTYVSRRYISKIKHVLGM